MFEPSDTGDAQLIVRSDVYELLGTCSPHGFRLDDRDWLSAEHYYQANKFAPGDYFDRIRAARHPEQARKLGEAWFKRKRSDWKSNRVLYMTRAMYTKCRAHEAVRKRLLETGNRRIIECSTFDFFWGCGRDGRGENQFGRMLMRIRDRLEQETSAREKRQED